MVKAYGAACALGKARTSFLKKRSKKLVLIWAWGVQTSGAKVTKVFWFFFSKKNGFGALADPVPGSAKPRLRASALY
jgi:hypothetical protein